jgi:hypothetical protein
MAYGSANVRVVASRDGRLLAESGGGSAQIRNIPSGQTLARLPGVGVGGFSWDGSEAVVSPFHADARTFDANLLAPGADREVVAVVKWGSNTTVFQQRGPVQWLQDHPGSADVLIVFPYGPAGGEDLLVVHSDGTSQLIARNILATEPCPCPSDDAR